MSYQENKFIKWLVITLATAIIPFMIMGVVNMIRMDTVLKYAKEAIEYNKDALDKKLDNDTFMLYLEVSEQKTQIFGKAFTDHIGYDSESFQQIRKDLDTLNDRINHLHKVILR